MYRMYHAWRGEMHLVSKQLHDKYGPVVRMAPGYLDVDYSSLIKTCFDVQGVWEKVNIFSFCFRFPLLYAAVERNHRAKALCHLGGMG